MSTNKKTGTKLLFKDNKGLRGGGNKNLKRGGNRHFTMN